MLLGAKKYKEPIKYYRAAHPFSNQQVATSAPSHIDQTFHRETKAVFTCGTIKK
jgi:hypothetical protein